MLKLLVQGDVSDPIGLFEDFGQESLWLHMPHLVYPPTNLAFPHYQIPYVILEFFLSKTEEL